MNDLPSGTRKTDLAGPPLLPPESPRVAVLAERARRDVDEAAGQLLLTVARGDASALLPLADRLEEIGRPELAEGFRAIARSVARDAALDAGGHAALALAQLDWRPLAERLVTEAVASSHD
jgi:hypothetical protein